MLQKIILLLFSPDRWHHCISFPANLRQAALTFLCTVFILYYSSQAKICNFATEGLRHQDVGCSEISVDGVHSLDICHSLGNLGTKNRKRMPLYSAVKGLADQQMSCFGAGTLSFSNSFFPASFRGKNLEPKHFKYP